MNQKEHFKKISKLLRDDRFWQIALQTIALILIITLIVTLAQNLIANLSQLGITLGFDFFRSQASFDIGESLINYDASQTYIQAIFVGFLNTFRVMVLGLIGASLVGLTVGIARLSENWLVRNLALIYVEIIRNTPLLLQLFFLYFAVFLAMPKLEENRHLTGFIYFTNRGIAFPWLIFNVATVIWVILVGMGIFVSVWLSRSRKWYWGGLAIGLSVILAFMITQKPPFYIDIPHITDNLQLEGGLKISPEFATLLTGLTLYTGSFIAEIVRAGIQSVPKGQWEAAKALGLTPGMITRLIIFPQALRVIIPPLTSQYLNLAKNSSLAIAIGYPDLYFVASTTFNQTGRAVEVMVLIMITYLTISLIISLAMNFYNKTVQIKER
ncbi:MAG: amino acid ABC transporter permease [Microcoleaceae cyanobacterium]